MFNKVLLSALILAISTVSVAQQREPQPRASEISAYSGGTQINGADGELSTGFETFSLGDINTQQGWVGLGNWVIADARPATGSQHVESVSDGLGLGVSLLLSPIVGIGSSPVNSVGFSIRLSATGATWELVPQSPTAFLVNTRIAIESDGSVSAVVDDGMAGVYTPIGFTMPVGEYVSFIVEVDRTTFDFEIYVNGVSTFTGTGFSGDIEQFVGVGLQEAGTGGDALDIDNVFIADGPAIVAPPAPVSVNGSWALALLLAMLLGLGLIAIRRSL